jgi:hypothetical protein
MARQLGVIISYGICHSIASKSRSSVDVVCSTTLLNNFAQHFTVERFVSGDRVTADAIYCMMPPHVPLPWMDPLNKAWFIT